MENNYYKYIKRCFQLALYGKGNVSPNPLVGAVIVKNNRIVSEGFHEFYGGPHAEANAINNSQESLEGAELYCNLEPCNHTNKKTPPCAPLIIKSGIKKVIISNFDPNPSVSGNGVKMLREAGIEVVVDILKEEGEELNKFFFKSVTERIPFVTLKIAATLNNLISNNELERSIITGVESQKDVHSLRAEYDAVLIGAGTLKADNPLLNVRNVEGRNPTVIILSEYCDFNLNYKVFQKDKNIKKIVYCGRTVTNERKQEFENNNVELFISIETLTIREKLLDFLKYLYTKGISSILIEGGAKIFSLFMNENLFDEVIYYFAPKMFNSGLSAYTLKKSIKLRYFKTELLDEDVKIIYKRL